MVPIIAPTWTSWVMTSALALAAVCLVLILFLCMSFRGRWWLCVFFHLLVVVPYIVVWCHAEIGFVV